MQAILEAFYQKRKTDRLYALKGIHGIGKSVLALQLCHYIQERALSCESIFKDGVIYLRLS